MAVSLRDYPVITGQDAQNFLKREENNKVKLQKKAAIKLASLKK